MKITFLHAPAFYDFRKRNAYYGPISDLIPSTPIFDMYPLGIISLASYLEKMGYKTKVINLAALMLLDKNYDVEARISKIKSDLIAIDLHWLVHAHGSLEIAKIVKKYHPDIPIVFGGHSSTYFYNELIKYPFVDFILRGDTTEYPFIRLLDAISGKIGFNEVPNLVWKKTNGELVVNSFSYVPLKVPLIEYEYVVKRVLLSRKWKEWLPYASAIDAPITAIFTVKGCSYNCITCGGSNFSYKNFFNRKKLAIKRPEDIYKEVSLIADYTKVTIFFVGDLRQTGMADEIINVIKEAKVDNPLMFEFFEPPSKEFLQKLRKVSDGDIYLQISPESHDDEIRKKFGRPYSTETLLKFLRNANELGFERTDLYFMIGLPKQTVESAVKTAEFAGNMASEKISTFIAPLAPFVDPGSMAFENPEKFGYKILYRTLEEHRKAFYHDNWYEFLNYETNWMNRMGIEIATINAIKTIAEIKFQKDLISPETYKYAISAISNGRNKRTKVDHLVYEREELYPTKNILNYLE